MSRRRETEDEYAGLMSQRDKQWIINIQLSQLKCENPYTDDYYYTAYTARQEARLRAELLPRGLARGCRSHRALTRTALSLTLSRSLPPRRRSCS